MTMVSAKPTHNFDPILCGLHKDNILSRPVVPTTKHHHANFVNSLYKFGRYQFQQALRQ